MPTPLGRHWFRFSLRTMFVVVTVFSVACGVDYWTVESGLYHFIRALVTGDWLPDQE
jgi:hypothetical protein